MSKRNFLLSELITQAAKVQRAANSCIREYTPATKKALEDELYAFLGCMDYLQVTDITDIMWGFAGLYSEQTREKIDERMRQEGIT